MSARRSGRGSTLLERWRRDWMLLLLVLPGFAYFVVFSYLPLFGYVIAFQDYLAVPWIHRERLGWARQFPADVLRPEVLERGDEHA